MDEFELIGRFFARATPHALLGIGDDCALLPAGPDRELAITTDMMVEGRHFLPDVDPQALGHKLLAVNLSDLAAMGATPRWALLAMALPSADAAWLAAFSSGLFALAQRHGVELVGGDTTRGPRNLTLTALGELPRGAGIRRSGARPGDDVWVSGTLGDAALALLHDEGVLALPAADLAACRERLDRPLPRVELGIALRGVASALIDVSDGLLGDLGHICAASGVAARVELASLPASAALRRQLGGAGGLSAAGSPAAASAAAPSSSAVAALGAQVAGGDDYELCFCAPPDARQRLAAIAQATSIPLTRVGVIVAEDAGGGSPAADRRSGLGRGRVTLVDAAGRELPPPRAAFDHFAAPGDDPGTTGR